MNADGSNAVPLTGGPDMTCAGYDENPAFTNDGTQIMFSRGCNDTGNESLYIMNTDGTGLAPLLTAEPGVWHYNPIAVGQKILFQSNLGNPNSYNFEIYSMNPDGTAVTKLTNNTLYDGFDLGWYITSSSASSQRSVRDADRRSLAHGAYARAAKAGRMQQHRR